MALIIFQRIFPFLQTLADQGKFPEFPFEFNEFLNGKFSDEKWDCNSTYSVTWEHLAALIH